VQAKLLVGSPDKGCSFQVLGATLVRTCMYIYIVWWEEAQVGSATQVACGVS